mmetsp:Transcript_18888/g.31233  ORF Transcript_18888/g.31233 Transcript_18888/m.31233 type:complete len:117 (-) Transcript_18888:1770-2120(-)
MFNCHAHAVWDLHRGHTLPGQQHLQRITFYYCIILLLMIRSELLTSRIQFNPIQECENYRYHDGGGGGGGADGMAPMGSKPAPLLPPMTKPSSSSSTLVPPPYLAATPIVVPGSVS